MRRIFEKLVYEETKQALSPELTGKEASLQLLRFTALLANQALSSMQSAKQFNPLVEPAPALELPVCVQAHGRVFVKLCSLLEPLAKRVSAWLLGGLFSRMLATDTEWRH